MLTARCLKIGIAMLGCVLLSTQLGKSSIQQAPRNGAPEDQSKQAGLVRLSARSEPGAAVPAAMSAAAIRNEESARELLWMLAGQQQRGWSIYTPLVSKLLTCDEDTTTPEFAFAISRWQRQNHLGVTGVLDEMTWSKMISGWQAKRIKDRSAPTPAQLVEVPASECFDPSRPAELRQVDRETFEAYKRMVRAAAADASLGLMSTTDGGLAASERYLKIISAFRSPEYQSQLRSKSPHSGRAGLAISSSHSTGRALDLYVGGEPVSTKDTNRAIQTQSAVYKWLVRNAGRFGFEPYFYEPWHWEYVSTGIRHQH